MSQRIIKKETKQSDVRKIIFQLVKKIVEYQVRQARVIEKCNQLKKQNLYLQQQKHILESRNQQLFSMLKIQKQKYQQDSYQNIYNKLQEQFDQKTINQGQNIKQKNIWIIKLLNQINQQRNMWMKKYEKMQLRIQEIKEQQMKKKHQVQIDNDKLKIMVIELKTKFEQEKTKNYFLQQKYEKNIEQKRSLSSTCRTNKSIFNKSDYIK